MDRRNIFHNASLRLTVIYLIIIMVLSLVFSIGLYRVSSQELENSLRRPLPAQQRRLLGGELAVLNELRQSELDDAQSRLKRQLIIINICIFFGASALSYLLARQTLRPIEEAHESQSRFTADASHELRTPITAMRTETEVTLMNPKLSIKEAKSQLESNIEELDKLTAISEGLLQLAQLDSQELDKEPIAINDIVESAVDRVQKKVHTKKQRLILQDISTEKITVNKNAIVEALVTLLDNASKYSSGESEIVISTKLHSTACEMTVTDKGVGISESDQQRIFDRFYQADSARTNSAEHGYGIGLSIAKSIAKAHNGNIRVSSSDKGSIFTLTVPQ